MANDRMHGQQFEASFLKVIPPTTLEGIEKCLSSGMTRGMGEAHAKRLVKSSGEAVCDVIEQHPERLSEVGGPARGLDEDRPEAFSRRRTVRRRDTTRRR